MDTSRVPLRIVRHLVTGLSLGTFLSAAESPQGATTVIPELLARDGSRYTNVTVTKIDQAHVSFRHDDGMSTLALSAFDDKNLDRLVPGHLASVKARQAAADAKEQERERQRDAQRKQMLEQDPEAAARARKEDDIREAALRYVLTHFEVPDLTKVSAIMIVIDRDTPSDEFLKRFATYKPQVRKIPRPKWNEIREGELSCSVSGPKWISETEAEIWVSRELPDDAVSFRYVLRLTEKGWVVIKWSVTGIT